MRISIPTMPGLNRIASRRRGVGGGSVPDMRGTGYLQHSWEGRSATATWSRWRPADQSAGTAPYRPRHPWTISALAALGLALVILTGATAAVCAWAGPPDTISAQAVNQDTYPAVLQNRLAQPVAGHAALIPALLLLLIPIRRGSACRNRRHVLAGRLDDVPPSGRSPPAVTTLIRCSPR